MSLPPVIEPRPFSCDAWLLLATPLFFALAGCHNTCVIFNSNQGGTLEIEAGDPPPSCSLPRATAALRVALHAAPTCEACAPSNRIEHIFISLRGIALHSSVIADDASPHWQELAPQLAKQPLQLDLMTVAAGSTARRPLVESTILTGEYRLVRLRLVSNQPAADEPLPEKNACGSAGFNCFVMTDGRIHPLLLSGAAPELRVESQRIAGGFLLFPPDSTLELAIEFEPVWSLSASRGGTARLLPSLTARVCLP